MGSPAGRPVGRAHGEGAGDRAPGAGETGGCRREERKWDPFGVRGNNALSVQDTLSPAVPASPWEEAGGEGGGRRKEREERGRSGGGSSCSVPGLLRWWSRLWREACPARERAGLCYTLPPASAGARGKGPGKRGWRGLETGPEAARWKDRGPATPGPLTRGQGSAVPLPGTSSPTEVTSVTSLRGWCLHGHWGLSSALWGGGCVCIQPSPSMDRLATYGSFWEFLCLRKEQFGGGGWV